MLVVLNTSVVAAGIELHEARQPTTAIIALEPGTYIVN